MPLYEYLCEACGWTVEVIQRVSEPPLTVCERCGSRLKKVLSPPAVRFKGSGWYVSDYGKSSASSSRPTDEPKPPEATSTGAPATTESPGPAAKKKRKKDS